ncbi:hypothetical protein Acr_08g0003250 [Actinidia rufa]|uniref:C2 domain-containing protein n=1 Tax=Actinidia rufa TaxID=165716 RepID=A0A7J0F143_9ERIC|nr:hypothetical protein Acr_08g0003250 [Actinidia rufa]
MNNHIPLEITLISADVFKKPNLFTRPRIYAVVSLLADSDSRQRTPADEHGGAKPFWNFPISIEIRESNLRHNSVGIILHLCQRRTLGGVKNIGSIYVPVKELLDYAGGRNLRRTVAFEMNSRSGKPKGVLYLSYLFGETICELVGMREKGGERVVVPSAPPCPPPSAPCLAAYGYFPAFLTSPAP